MVVLTGEVDWNHERFDIERAVERVPGVQRVDNRIALTRRASAADTGERIRNALVRHAILDASHIQVAVEGTRVTLTGSVSSWDERQRAEHSAWSSPHVTDVDNQLVIMPRR